ncbi:MAG: tRNA (adenosine(37)-N6)-dimethylallyltransferase MiaA [Oscillospiraceae bacterium]|nr:tRNA (adenosine(37)-N6)-dimethylallyltransferase MiaA [Oscillospiraceae bacterium]
MNTKIPVVAVIGPTASGKTGLAVKIAKEFNGEVISADSMQIYSELCIGTAKPTKEEMEGIKHHLVGHKSIDEEYSVVDYVEEAKKAISDVFSRGKLPVLCGGTGLYVDSLLSGTEFSEIKSDPQVRKNLFEYIEKNGCEALYNKLMEIDPECAQKTHPNNVIRVVRAMEVFEITGKTISEHQKNSHPKPSEYNVCYIGTTFADREKLYARIEQRIDEMLDEGVEEEAQFLFEHAGTCTAAQAIGYKEFYPYFKNEMSREEAVSVLKKETRHYAKRQLTWFRRNKDINWLCRDEFSSKEELFNAAFKIIENFLEKQ